MGNNDFGKCEPEKFMTSILSKLKTGVIRDIKLEFE